MCKLYLSLENFWFSKKRNCHHSCCKNCSNEANKKNRNIEFSGSWFNRKYQHLKRNAIKRNVLFDLTLEDFTKIVKKLKCFYCEKIPKVKTIDRKNNKNGYLFKNCVLACYECNILKRYYTKKDFQKLCIIAKKLKWIS